MNTRENIIAALNGDTPDMTPLTFYSWMVTMGKKENEHLLFEDQWKRLYDMSLGICHHEYWIKTPADYKVMTWIMENTELVPCFDEFHRGEELVGDNGLAVWILPLRCPNLWSCIKHVRNCSLKKQSLLPKGRADLLSGLRT